ncbi:MAG: hypothetical protein AAF152_09515 [Cyanobacteria bacterium P01_A01_bin.114]
MTDNELLHVIETVAEEVEVLNLFGENLKVLPSEIGQLKNLRTLYLRYTCLDSMPPEIEQLTNLQSFYISNNQLSSLPSEIGQLRSLQTLHHSEK